MSDVGELRVTFHGVRGSTPCHGPTTARYGGNTSCVSVWADGEKPLLCDLGTGLRYFGKQWEQHTTAPIDAVALVSHLHWDHIQGLPFFVPMLRDGAHLEVYGPSQTIGAGDVVDSDAALAHGDTFRHALHDTVRPPTFPVTLKDFAGKFTVRDVADNVFTIGGYTITSRVVPHIGPTVGYRIEYGSKSVAYISDHQQAHDGSMDVPDSVRELADGVDLLIHDAQYTPAEFAQRYNWGHCTQEFAVRVGLASRARSVALYHHDPERTDDELDNFSPCGDTRGSDNTDGMGVFAAREGQTVIL